MMSEGAFFGGFPMNRDGRDLDRSCRISKCARSSEWIGRRRRPGLRARGDLINRFQSRLGYQVSNSSNNTFRSSSWNW